MKKEEFRIRVVQGTGGIPAGASIVVQSETKNRYKGIWPNGPCTMSVSILKKHCEKE
jgi:hypothetical protein